MSEITDLADHLFPESEIVALRQDNASLRAELAAAKSEVAGLRKGLKDALFVIAAMPSYEGGCGNVGCKQCEADASVSLLQHHIRALLAPASPKGAAPQCKHCHTAVVNHDDTCAACQSQKDSMSGIPKPLPEPPKGAETPDAKREG